jgi:toxin ParE1/3/4
MADVRITPRAKEHLLDIWAYTAEQWSEGQADAYLRDINSTYGQLAENPKLGVHRPDIALGYRSIPSGKHVVFYTLAQHGNYVNIIGVLHAQMDVRTHLD